MNLQNIKEFIGIVGAIYGILALISAAAGILSGFLVEGIMAAFIIVAAGILYLFFIRKPQVVGTYNVKGKNPINEELYSGELQIKKQGELLLGTWKIGTPRGTDAPKPSDEGTGLLVGNALAFSYKHTDPEDPYTGVALYKIRGGHISGKWGVVEKSNAGFEECWKERA